MPALRQRPKGTRDVRLRRDVLVNVAVLGALLYGLFSIVVALRALDASDLRVDEWVTRNVGGTLLGVRWSAITTVGGTFTAASAVCVAAFLAWRSGAARTAVVIVVVSLAGGMAVDALKGVHGRPYPGHGAVVYLRGDGEACPPDTRCDFAVRENATAYCAEGARCSFYIYNGTAQERVNATVLPPDFSGFPTRSGRAYPSGHTMGATLSWGTALLLGTRAVRRRAGFDRWAIGAWAAVAFLGGLSRIPVHAHWWTDVVGSWILGCALLAAAILIDDHWARRAAPADEQDDGAAPGPAEPPAA